MMENISFFQENVHFHCKLSQKWTFIFPRKPHLSSLKREKLKLFSHRKKTFYVKIVSLVQIILTIKTCKRYGKKEKGNIK